MLNVALTLNDALIIQDIIWQVYQWGGGKLTPQNQDIFVKGKSATQVIKLGMIVWYLHVNSLFWSLVLHKMSFVTDMIDKHGSQFV